MLSSSFDNAYKLHTRHQFRILNRILLEGINRTDFDEILNIPVVLNMVSGMADMGNLMLRLGKRTGFLVDDFDSMMDLIEPVLVQPAIKSNKAADKTNRILQAAEKVFGEKGYDQSAIQDVVKEANIAEGSVYWYFKNKPTDPRGAGFDLSP